MRRNYTEPYVSGTGQHRRHDVLRPVCGHLERDSRVCPQELGDAWRSQLRHDGCHAGDPDPSKTRRPEIAHPGDARIERLQDRCDVRIELLTGSSRLDAAGRAIEKSDIQILFDLTNRFGQCRRRDKQLFGCRHERAIARNGHKCPKVP
nr:hypothetical protein [Variovorax sp. E3]